MGQRGLMAGLMNQLKFRLGSEEKCQNPKNKLNFGHKWKNKGHSVFAESLKVL